MHKVAAVDSLQLKAQPIHVQTSPWCWQELLGTKPFLPAERRGQVRPRMLENQDVICAPGNNLTPVRSRHTIPVAFMLQGQGLPLTHCSHIHLH